MRHQVRLKKLADPRPDFRILLGTSDALMVSSVTHADDCWSKPQLDEKSYPAPHEKHSSSLSETHVKTTGSSVRDFSIKEEKGRKSHP
jgi:hypothetical protein